MSSEESLSVRSISVDVETPEKETEQIMATVAELAKLRVERSAAADGNSRSTTQFPSATTGP